jgi:MATE family multidrug resistance protein
VVFFLFGLGTLFGLDRIVSFAFGAGRADECRRALAQGLWLSLAFSIPAIAAQQFLASHLDWFGYDVAIRADAAAYLRALSWSLLPALVFTALRGTLQAMDDVLAATVILLVANVVNVVANQALIDGEWV